MKIKIIKFLWVYVSCIGNVQSGLFGMVSVCVDDVTWRDVASALNKGFTKELEIQSLR